MQKYKNYAWLGIAVIIAAIATIIVTNVVRKAQRGYQDEVAQVVTAKVDLKGGMVIQKEMVNGGIFLKKSLPAKAFSEPEKVVGRVLITNIPANIPICESHLAPATLRTGGVSAIVAPEKRAIAVKVDKVIGVAGFVHPNNRVDVLVNLKRVEGMQAPINKIVLQNILVLAVGPDIEQKGKEEKSTPTDVVTLEVTPEEAEKLSLAVQEGKISLALRNFGDSKEVVTAGITPPELISSYSRKTATTTPAKSEVSAPKKSRGGARSQKEVKKEEKKEAPKVVVEVVRGTKVNEVKFEQQ